jgi:hypothetical protein
LESFIHPLETLIMGPDAISKLNWIKCPHQMMFLFKIDHVCLTGEIFNCSAD